MPFARTTRVFLAAALSLVALPLPLFAQEAETPRGGVETDREGARPLALPRGEAVWHFAIFGDRTSGPPEGVDVLRRAVDEVNLLDPDLVLTVGDLIQGYNTEEPWLAEMREYRTAMADLRMPWYPVAGNHDVYWRGPDRPESGHEVNYERHFGPLWYWFRHKDSAFIVLYTDEGDPEDGSKGFSARRHIQMSERQLAWLEAALAGTADARHVFVLCHHPRWIDETYVGSNWDEVHRRLVGAGNVRAVFAGHIHHLDHRTRDGIEYFTLGTTGGNKSMEFPAAGYLHHFDIVTVRPGGIQVATLPVGAVIDPREIDRERRDALLELVRGWVPEFEGDATVDLTASDDRWTLTLGNPAPVPLSVTVRPRSPGPGWWFGPDHVHRTIEPGARVTVPLRSVRSKGALAEVTEAPRVEFVRELLLPEGARLHVPPHTWTAPLELGVPSAEILARAAAPGTLALDGRGDAVRVDSDALDLPDGPFTVEGWVRPASVDGRRPFLAKTESSEFALYISNGVPEFMVHLDGRYRDVESRAHRLVPGRWTHLAGVFDGEELRLYVDGTCVAREEARGSRTPNPHAFWVGADPDRSGAPTDFLEGSVDEVRISVGARYGDATFTPPRALEPDADTRLLLSFGCDLGPFVIDRSGHGAHGHRRGDAHCVPGAGIPTSNGPGTNGTGKSGTGTNRSGE